MTIVVMESTILRCLLRKLANVPWSTASFAHTGVFPTLPSLVRRKIIRPYSIPRVEFEGGKGVSEIVLHVFESLRTDLSGL